MDTFTEFYQLYVDKLFTYCMYKTGRKAEAEDIVSDTFLRFYRAEGWKRESPVAYLYTICRNLITDYYRRKRSDTSLESFMDAGGDIGSVDDLETKLMVADVLKHIHLLPEDQKDVLLFQYVQDLDNKTIAEIISKSESAVKSLAHRGIETLREKFRRQGKNEKN